MTHDLEQLLDAHGPDDARQIHRPARSHLIGGPIHQERDRIMIGVLPPSGMGMSMDMIGVSMP